MRKKLVAGIAVLALTGAMFAQTATPIFAGGKPGGPPEEHAKCNSGRGNQSETTPATDCDPGKSFKNQGGD